MGERDSDETAPSDNAQNADHARARVVRAAEQQHPAATQEPPPADSQAVEAATRNDPTAGRADSRSATDRTRNTPTAGPTDSQAVDAAARNHPTAGPADSRSATDGRSALLIDWGGVLTSNLFVSFHEYCVRNEIDSEQLVASFRSNPDFRDLLIALEKGRIAEPEFERRFATILGVDSDGLIDGLFAGVQPDTAMVQAVRAARNAGIRTALVSNSWGVHRYPHDLFDELFDGVVISAEEGARKPSKRMYELGAQRAGAQLQECVFVDDLPFNLTPAQELGMATVHHTDADTTIPELERLLGVALAIV